MDTCRGDWIIALSNWEIATYAVYLSGGASSPIHTEDVALKCFELAPHSFSWIKYPNRPDKEVARSALVDARKEKCGALVKGRSGRGRGQTSKTLKDPAADGWQLTPAGVKWIIGNENRLAFQFVQQIAKPHRQATLQRLSRVRSHPLFENFRDEPNSFVPPLGALAELLRCRVDAERAVWEKRFLTLRNEAQLTNQHDVLAFLEACQTHISATLKIHGS